MDNKTEIGLKKKGQNTVLYRVESAKSIQIALVLVLLLVLSSITINNKIILMDGIEPSN